LSAAAYAPFGGSDPTGLAGKVILQMIPRLEAGGAERTTVDVAQALVRVGARALVATEGGRLIVDLQIVGGAYVPFPAATKNPIKMLANIGRLARLIEQEGVDLVHARSRAPAWVALVATRRTDRRFVTTYHGDYSAQSRAKRLYNSVMARGDCVIANSEYTSERVTELYPFARNRLKVIARGADLVRFSRSAVESSRVAQIRAAWDVAPEARIILLPGRLTAWKGQKTLIEAASILHGEGLSNLAFVLAGDAQGRNAYLRELGALIRARKLEGVVRIVGHCADMPAAFVAASVVAAPSNLPEAFGRVAVEAQAMGVPVIVSDLGAARETVLAPPQADVAERTGWLIPPDDPVTLAQVLKEALEMGASARAQLAWRARARVERDYSLERMTAETLKVYAGLLRPEA